MELIKESPIVVTKEDIQKGIARYQEKKRELIMASKKHFIEFYKKLNWEPHE